MHSPSDTIPLRDFLAAARRRRSVLVLLEGAGGGLAIACLLAAIGWPVHHGLLPILRLGALLMVAGALVRYGWTHRRPVPIARAVERRTTACHNLLVTAEELLEQHGRTDGAAARTSAYLMALVVREANKAVASLDLPQLFPLRQRMIAFGVALLMLVLLAGRAASPMAAPLLSGAGGNMAQVEDVDITVTPPAYTGQSARTLHNPERIEALAGSHLVLAVAAHAEAVGLETLDRVAALTRTAPGRFAGALVAAGDGYLAFEPQGSDSAAGARRLIGLSVQQDNAPRVRITKPGRDIKMLDGNQTLDITVTTDDDIGLASLRLAYTKVSGIGERFTFVEGDVPLSIARTDAKNWTATAHWRLNPLELEAGDVVVYRAIVTDHRPGRLPTESDAFLAEVLAPGGVAASGFDIDTDMERYALSQQMVILKSERLLARRSAMAADSFADASAELAVEQRSVRAQFVFMMGGEIAADPASMTDLNETEEAEGEADLGAGYSRNQGRDALQGAIRSMSRASGALTDVEVPKALVHEKAALAMLEKAFSHTRILLRALGERERLDLTRRQTGPLVDAGRDTRAAVTADPVPMVVAMRHALAGIASASAGLGTGGTAPGTLQLLAEQVLRIDPAATALHDVSSQLTAASTAVGGSRREEAARALDRAASSLVSALRLRLQRAPAGETTTADRIGGALSEALRPGGPR